MREKSSSQNENAITHAQAMALSLNNISLVIFFFINIPKLQHISHREIKFT